MSEFLHPRDWFKIRRGDLVKVRTRAVHPQLHGVYQIKKVAHTSNFPYRVWHDGEMHLLEKSEVTLLGKITE